MSHGATRSERYDDHAAVGNFYIEISKHISSRREHGRAVRARVEPCQFADEVAAAHGQEVARTGPLGHCGGRCSRHVQEE